MPSVGPLLGRRSTGSEDRALESNRNLSPSEPLVRWCWSHRRVVLSFRDRDFRSTWARRFGTVEVKLGWSVSLARGKSSTEFHLEMREFLFLSYWLLGPYRSWYLEVLVSKTFLARAMWLFGKSWRKTDRIEFCPEIFVQKSWKYWVLGCSRGFRRVRASRSDPSAGTGFRFPDPFGFFSSASFWAYGAAGFFTGQISPDPVVDSDISFFQARSNTT